ncbi:F-box/LRR-repeat protein 14-like protein isoform X1, partial [Tanacetum coccineum]
DSRSEGWEEDIDICEVRCNGHFNILAGVKKLEALNINCCNCITDIDMKPLSDLTNLKELQISCSKVTHQWRYILERVDKFGVFKRLVFTGNRLRITTFSKSEEVEVVKPRSQPK